VPVRVVENALAAVMAYLDGLLSGRPNQPIKLFPYYRDVLQLSGMQSRASGRSRLSGPLAPSGVSSDRSAAVHAARPEETGAPATKSGLLGFLRNTDDAKARKAMRESLAELEHMPQRGLARSFWWITRGLLEALEAGAVAVDVDLKRVMARLNLQLRRMIDGGGAVAERLDGRHTLLRGPRQQQSCRASRKIKRLVWARRADSAGFRARVIDRGRR
jgi:chemosensory pili system protein ChpA (sensor histidine kinase/response regulator)